MVVMLVVVVQDEESMAVRLLGQALSSAMRHVVVRAVEC